MYVDLNPIRAAMAESPEKSEFTSAYDRIAAQAGKKIESCAAQMRAIPRDEAAKMLRALSPDQLREKRKRAKKRKGPGIDSEMWIDLVWNFRKYFGKSRGAGSPDRMREMAVSGGKKFQPGQKRARKCFV